MGGAMGLFGKPNVEALQAKQDVKGLIRALPSHDGNVHDAAAKALGEIGPPAVEPLIARMKLGWHGFLEDAFYEVGTPAVEPLIAVLKDARCSERVGKATQNALAAVGVPAIASLIAIVEEHQHSKFFFHAIKALEQISEETCKSFHGGRCIVQGVDTGPCTWRPSRWQSCSVVVNPPATSGGAARTAVRTTTTKYKQALKYLDDAEQLSAEVLQEVIRIAGSTLSSSEIRSAIGQSGLMQPGAGKPGDLEALRDMLRGTLVEGIRTFGAAADELGDFEDGTVQTADQPCDPASGQERELDGQSVTVSPAQSQSKHVCAVCERELAGDDLASAKEREANARRVEADYPYRKPGMPPGIILAMDSRGNAFYCQTCLDTPAKWQEKDKRCINCESFACNVVRMDGVPDLYCTVNGYTPVQVVSDPFGDSCASWQLGKPFRHAD